MKKNNSRKILVLMRMSAHPDDCVVMGIMRYFNECRADRQVAVADSSAITAEALDKAMSGDCPATTDIRIRPGTVTGRETTSRRPKSRRTATVA